VYTLLKSEISPFFVCKCCLLLLMARGRERGGVGEGQQIISLLPLSFVFFSTIQLGLTINTKPPWVCREVVHYNEGRR